VKVKVGDLVKFDYINGHTRNWNGKVGVYLGEAFITRSDGVVVENHKVVMNGEAKPTIMDRTLLRYMRKFE
jgi:hypothetical protein